MYRYWAVIGLLAQTQTPTITDPVAPWISIFLQAGAFGLITYIVTILYPRFRKDDAAERATRDTAFATIITSMQDKFEERNNALVQAIEKQTDRLSNTFSQGTSKVEQAVEKIIETQKEIIGVQKDMGRVVVKVLESDQ